MKLHSMIGQNMCGNCILAKEQTERRKHYHGYVPIPVWNGREWEPTHFSFGQMCWPEGFNPDTIPRPKYQIGDIVEFRWQGGVLWTGYVQRIKLRGGGYFASDGSELEVCESRYRVRHMTYTVYSHGHGRWLQEPRLLRKVGTQFNPMV
jgi:hypothetical protein